MSSRSNRVAPTPFGDVPDSGFQDDSNQQKRDELKMQLLPGSTILPPIMESHTTADTTPPGVTKFHHRYKDSWTTPADGNNSADGNQISATSGEGGLLEYFQKLRTSDDDLDPLVIDQFLENGADLHVTSQATGEGIMHEVATHWDKNLASYLHQKGLGIDQRDKNGRTPLHMAASTNHVEMVEWLADEGADLRAKTHAEEQTPLHHAARYDSVQTIQALIRKGGDCEVFDYKGRTPLHLAAELDRTGAVECLISVPILAEVRVQDNAGNHAIASMIRTMPQVALQALDQLHRISPAKRKQFFLLNHLEPEPGVCTSRGVKTPFEVAVEEKRRNILSHPVMQVLIAQKWRYVRWLFYSYLVYYFVFLLSWTLLIAYPSVQNKHQYNFPVDVWRIVVALIALMTYMAQVIEEVIEIIFSAKRSREYKAMRRKILQDDLSNLSANFVEERQFLESEISRLSKKIPSYFTDLWNYVDLVTYLLILVLICLHLADVFSHTTNLALWTARVSCFVALLIWSRLFKLARGFRSLGPLVAIISQSLGDILRYFILYTILFVPYIVCFWVLFGGPQAASLTPGEEDLSIFYRVAIMIFRMGLIDDYPYSSLRSIDEAMAAILVITFLVFIAVVGLNLFIALLSDTFQRVYDNAQSIAVLQQAKLILSYEDKVCEHFITRYRKHIHEKCSPHAEFFDDDEYYSKETNTEVRKITHQIHSIVSDLLSKQQKESEIGARELAGVSGVFADYVEEHDGKIASITQQLEELKRAVSQDGGSATPAAASPIEILPPAQVPPWKDLPPLPHATFSTPTSPTRAALNNVFSLRRRLQNRYPLPPISKQLSIRPSRGRLSQELMYSRGESDPGEASAQTKYHKAKRASVQEQADVEWEKKSRPMKRTS